MWWDGHIWWYFNDKHVARRSSKNLQNNCATFQCTWKLWQSPVMTNTPHVSLALWVAGKYLGAILIWRCRLASIGIHMLKVRQSHDCLIFNMGIPIPRNTALILRWGPGIPHGFIQSREHINLQCILAQLLVGNPPGSAEDPQNINLPVMDKSTGGIGHHWVVLFLSIRYDWWQISHYLRPCWQIQYCANNMLNNMITPVSIN